MEKDGIFIFTMSFETEDEEDMEIIIKLRDKISRWAVKSFGSNKIN